jgi:1-acyl-sn-glycerol-3-phosphate acyltransferase
VRAESLSRRWFRRCVSLPTFALLWAVVHVGLPLWLLLFALVDLARGQARRTPLVRAMLFFCLYLTCEIVGVLAALCVWCFTLGGLLVSAESWKGIHLALQRSFTNTLLRGALRVFSMRTAVAGADRVLPGPLILMLRHSSTADTVLAAALLTNAHRLGLRYVLKRELLWDPCLDVVGQRLLNAFVERDGADTEGARAQIRALTEHLGALDGVLIYPEGTRFNAAKLARIKARTDKDHPAQALTHVMPPKLGGPLVLLERGVDVLFVDHVGLEGAASFSEFFSGGLIGKTVRVRVRRIACADIPQEGREAWLNAQWQETNEWVREQSVHDP